MPGQLSRCESHMLIWAKCLNTPHDTSMDQEKTLSTTTSCKSGNHVNGVKMATNDQVKVFQSIEEGLYWLTKGRDGRIQPQECSMDENGSKAEHDVDHIQVLCTGSLHLVGGVIRVIEPSRYEEIVLSLA